MLGLGILGNVTKYIFTGGRALKLVKTGVNVANSTNPLQVTKNITLVVVDCCCPIPICIAAHCIGASASIVALISTPNPVTIVSAINLVNEIYENY